MYYCNLLFILYKLQYSYLIDKFIDKINIFVKIIQKNIDYKLKMCYNLINKDIEQIKQGGYI